MEFQQMSWQSLFRASKLGQVQNLLALHCYWRLKIHLLALGLCAEHVHHPSSGDIHELPAPVEAGPSRQNFHPYVSYGRWQRKFKSTGWCIVMFLCCIN